MPREDGQFGPGNVPANPPPDTTGQLMPPPMLASFRRAFKGIKVKADSGFAEGDKAAKKLMAANPKEFFSTLERMEREFNERKAAHERSKGAEAVPEKDSAPERDERLEAVDELIGELLAKWEAA